MSYKGVICLLFILSAAVILSGCRKTSTCDVNRDGKPDVTYYSEGEYISKVEADTNYDGKTDVIVNIKDGKFHSAEADTDHNGTVDEKFTSRSSFVNWLNADSPEFKDKLDKTDWRATKQF